LARFHHGDAPPSCHHTDVRRKAQFYVKRLPGIALGMFLLRHTVPVLQQLAQRFEIDVGIPFMVVDEPDSHALQAGQARRQAVWLGHIFRGRM
jgi:hypothetical protein